MAQAIASAIRSVIESYKEKYDTTPWFINCGKCDMFGTAVLKILGYGEMYCHDEMPDCTEFEAFHWSHYFLVIHGRFYDAESPEGVDKWRELPLFVNNPTPSTQV